MLCGGLARSGLMRMSVEVACNKHSLRVLIEERDPVFELGTTALAYYRSGEFTDIRKDPIPTIPGYPLGPFLE